MGLDNENNAAAGYLGPVKIELRKDTGLLIVKRANHAFAFLCASCPLAGNNFCASSHGSRDLLSLRKQEAVTSLNSRHI